MGDVVGLPVHSRVAAHLEEYARGLQPPEGRDVWDRHVETCDDCNAALFRIVDRTLTEGSARGPLKLV